jgi:hypothetical protein
MDREQLPPSPDLRLTLEQRLLTDLVEHARLTRRYAGICAIAAAVFVALSALTFLAWIVVAAENA